MQRYLKLILPILVLLGAAIAGFLMLTHGNNNQSNTSVSPTNTQLDNSNQAPSNTNTSTSEVTENNKPIPQKLTLAVPFTPQAPTANWDELHNEACEEASLIMANAYFNNITSLPPAVVEKEITHMTKWQQDNLGYYLSITTEEAARMARDVYDFKTEIVDLTEKNIKQALANDKLVVYPADGRLLNNPNFKQPGPIYHMLLITGFDGSTFISNDPGTRNGKSYKYKYSVLEEAGGSWSHSAHAMDLSNKKIIIVSK